MARIFKEKQLLLASGNQGKIIEITDLLSDYSVEVLSAKEFDIEEPEETGKTFAENAILKAKYYSDETGTISLADDSGLVIPALDGQPGIYSARWAGVEKNFNLAMNRVKEALFAAKGKEYEIDDYAYFICVLALYWPEDDHVEVFEGRVDGNLRFPPAGKDGFGYDPIFIPTGYDISFADMDKSQKKLFSHRGNAFREMIKACFDK
jgi:XTP/dITP diphosphohydrolase